jgi:hypothetical protein
MLVITMENYQSTCQKYEQKTDLPEGFDEARTHVLSLLKTLPEIKPSEGLFARIMEQIDKEDKR